MRNISRVTLMVLCVAFIMSSCKASQFSGLDRLSESSADKVDRLLDQGDIVAASDVVVENETYFAVSSSDPEIKKVLDRLAGALDYTYSPKAQVILEKVNAIQWPEPQAAWAKLKEEIAGLHDDLDKLGTLSIFKYPQYRPRSIWSSFAGLAGQRVCHQDGCR